MTTIVLLDIPAGDARDAVDDGSGHNRGEPYGLARSVAGVGVVTTAILTPYARAAQRLLVVPVVFVGVFTVWPAATTLRRGFDFTGEASLIEA